jgi:hypothetical protein
MTRGLMILMRTSCKLYVFAATDFPRLRCMVVARRIILVFYYLCKIVIWQSNTHALSRPTRVFLLLRCRMSLKF